MDFKISGVVSERRSGNPVKGVLVVAYDKDPLFDELLGTAETDAKGQFLIEYVKLEYSDFFGKNPDVYLAVFAPPCTMLTDTSKNIRWGATQHEFFNLTIDDDKLRDAFGPEAKEAVHEHQLTDFFAWEVC